MLKRFFLNTLSSFIGAWIALIIFVIFGIIAIIGITAKIGLSENRKQVSKQSVLVINLSGEIEENEKATDIDYIELIQGNVAKKQTLASLSAAIKAAAENKNIEAIYLKCGVASAAPATYDALRTSLLEFKKSGKKIIAYGDLYSNGTYYVATVADELCLNPAGHIALTGMGGTTLFYKDLFDKIGIEFQVVKVGTYKSAVEPYILPSMSEPARAQLDTLYTNIWQYICEGITEERPVLTESAIDSLINKEFIFLKEGPISLKDHLADNLYYERSVDSLVAATIKVDKEKLNYVDPSMLVSQEDFAMGYTAKNQIAVLYASGEIMDGGNNSTINYERFVPIITSLAENDKVKGMVLRVNSPGGSAFGSEQIGEALDYFQSKGKPLAVSMGDYAASGGYWISCGADKIFANPLTITGSIGIFGLIPNASKLLKKIGLNAELVSTNPQADFPTLMFPLNPSQLDAMQQMVETGYDKFVGRVAKGRHLPESEVRRIGEGRVWDAQKALQIGLVDSLGNLQDAIDWVAGKLDLKDYGVGYYPKFENSIWDYLPELAEMETKIKENLLKNEKLPADLCEKVKNVLMQKPLQARMPEIDMRIH